MPRNKPNPRTVSWTDAEIEALRDLRAGGRSTREISAAMGRSPGSVRAALRRYRVSRPTGQAARRCMLCNSFFWPDGRFNMICPVCKARPEFQSGGDFTIMGGGSL